MLVQLPTFNGVSPRVTPRLLGETFATIARDVKLWNGSLRPWRGLTAVATLNRPGTEKTIYRFGQDALTDADYWFSWTTDVDVVRSPVATGERTFFTGDGAPKVTDTTLALTGGGPLPNAAYTLGVPSPTLAPGAGDLAVSGTAGPNEQPVDRYFVYTFVNSWGEEGGASPVSEKTTAYASQTITLSALEVPSGAQGFTAKRIYETQGTGAAADFFLVAEVAAGATTAAFPANSAATPSTTSTGVGARLETAAFTPPPADLHSLRILPGPVLCGLSGNKLRFSAFRYPYAWPAIYEYPFEFDPVALGVYGNTVVVATKGVPYLVQGLDPEAMQVTKLEYQYACVAKTSMVEVGGGVAYASPDGMVLVDTSGVRLITTDHFDRDQWQALKPESMRSVWWDNRLVIFYDTGAVRGSLIFEPGREPVFSTVWGSAAYVDPLRDALYVALNDQVWRFDAGSSLTFLWRSKVFRVPRPLNFGAGKITASGPVTLRVYGDGVLRATRVVSSAEVFRLPAGYTARDWEIELEGTSEVFFAAIAETAAELRAV